jgi:hypothetical protein
MRLTYAPGERGYGQIRLALGPPPEGASGIGFELRTIERGAGAQVTIGCIEADADSWLLNELSLPPAGSWQRIEGRFHARESTFQAADGAFDPSTLSSVTIALKVGPGSVLIDDLRWLRD